MSKRSRAAVSVLVFLAPVLHAVAGQLEDPEYAGFVIALRFEEGGMLKLPASLDFAVRQDTGGNFQIQLTERGIGAVEGARKAGQAYQTRIFRGSKAALRNVTPDKDDCFSFQSTVIPLDYLERSIIFGIDRMWLDVDGEMARRQPYVLALESQPTRPEFAGQYRLETFRIRSADFQQYLANSIEIYAAPAPDGRFEPNVLAQIRQGSKPVTLSLTGVRCFEIKKNPPRVLAVSPGAEVYGFAYAAECS
jgi:hypothetical protein